MRFHFGCSWRILIHLSFFVIIINLFLYRNPVSTLNRLSQVVPDTPPISLSHLIFGIATSANSWPKRNQYVRLWWNPKHMRGCVFLDAIPENARNSSDLPSLHVSRNTSQFPYTYKRGFRSAIRVARIVSEIFSLNFSDVRWFVFGDDDTVFFPENLVSTLAKYDHNQWIYVGSNSESVLQNTKNSFQMAFGGGGFAISYPLVRVLARVFDSCLDRYSHLYGSDARVYSCLTELGVGLCHEPGFHQVDVRGNLFGLLSAHPLVPLVSLHHMDYIDPIFPNMNRIQALKHLFKAVEVDPSSVLQQTVCYDHSNSWTISISWGYSIQIFKSNELLPDLLAFQKTFGPWHRGRNATLSNHYMFNTREVPRDPCEAPAIFFFQNIFSNTAGIESNYTKQGTGSCLEDNHPSRVLSMVTVFSQKSAYVIRKSSRRQCCDVLSSSSDHIMKIGIRHCGSEELIYMHKR